MNRRILYQESSRSHQQRIKKRIVERLSLIQSEMLEPHGLKFRRVVIDSNVQDRIENFKCEILLKHDATISFRKIIHIKDKHNISDVIYESFKSQLQLQLPTLVKLKTERRVYDHMINILENSKGAYLSIKKKLKLLIPKIKKNFTEQDSHILHIKYSADGAQITFATTFASIFC
jgi:hypothetical protein